MYVVHVLIIDSLLSGTLQLVVVVYSQLLPFPPNASCVSTQWRPPLTPPPLHCRRIDWMRPLGDHAHHGTERVLLLVQEVALGSKGAESAIPTIKQYYRL